MSKNKPSFNEMLKNPLLFLASSYTYFLVVLVGLGLLYITNLGAIYNNAVPPRLVDSTQLVTDLQLKNPAVLKAVEFENIKTPTPEMLAKGKATFEAVCVSCHGGQGKGDGVAGVALNPKPRNFHAKEGWKNGRNLAGMYMTLQNGIAANGMPAYDNLPVDERLGVIHYIMQNFMEGAPAITDAEVTQLDEEYQLSKGTEEPGILPVAGAKKLVMNEKADLSKRLNSALEKLKSMETDDNARLFKSVTGNSSAALATLINDNTWNKDVKSFRAMLDKNIVQNGFAPAVLRLGDDEFARLYNFLKGLLA